MIVPFLFTFDEYSPDKPTHQWVAFKFLDFCYKNKFPIIIQQKYLGDHEGHPSSSKKFQEMYDYKILTQEQQDSIDKYIITEEDENEIKRNFKNLDETYISLLKENNKNFEKIINKFVVKIKEKYNEKIEAIITWIYYPTLEKVCRKHNIPVISYELSTIRKNNVYRNTLGYFKFGNKYENKEEFMKINDFDTKSNLLLNNKEIINLFIDDSNINYINYPDEVKEYDVGVAFGLKKDFFHMVYDKNKYNDMLEKISKFVPFSKILVRFHPGMSPSSVSDKYSVDHSPNSVEFISKCKSIVCSISNIGYESILFGNPIISTNDNMITSFGKTNKLNYNDAQFFGMKELNFLTFYYYSPYKLMFDVEYIRYRLREKNVNKIYNYNINYILKEYNVSIEDLKDTDLNTRFLKLLDTHNIASEAKKELFDKYSNTNMLMERIRLLESKINNLEKEKETYKNESEALKNEIDSIFNSKSWKVTKPLRVITTKISDIKNK